MRLLLGIGLGLTLLLVAQEAPPQKGEGKGEKKGMRKRTPPPGVSTPGVKRPMEGLKPLAEVSILGVPDWQMVTADSVWVSNGPKDTVHRIDAKTSKEVAVVTVGKRPCSGLAQGFGSLWVPLCGERQTKAGAGLARVDEKTNKVIATIPVGPADSEGGVATSKDAVWIVSDPKGVLSRVDPKTNKVVAEIPVPAGSVAVYYFGDSVWVTANKSAKLVRVNAKTNKVTAEIPVGKDPRFLTAGGGSVWTVNQGDGTVTRVNGKTGKVEATIEAGLIATGGEVSFGGGGLWVTLFDIPITFIDEKTNQVTKQWVGPGGDAIRYGHGSIWLSNLRQQTLWRLDPKQM